MTHEEKKAAYDSTLAGLESNTSKLEQVSAETDLLSVDLAYLNKGHF